MTQPIPYPQPIPMGRMHRCKHPVRHSVNVVLLLVGWLYWSIHTNGQWGPMLAAYLDPKGTGIGLPIAVLTNLAWLVLIPLGHDSGSISWGCGTVRDHSPCISGQTMSHRPQKSPACPGSRCSSSAYC